MRATILRGHRGAIYLIATLYRRVLLKLRCSIAVLRQRLTKSFLSCKGSLLRSVIGVTCEMHGIAFRVPVCVIMSNGLTELRKGVITHATESHLLGTVSKRSTTHHALMLLLGPHALQTLVLW